MARFCNLDIKKYLNVLRVEVRDLVMNISHLLFFINTFLEHPLHSISMLHFVLFFKFLQIFPLVSKLLVLRGKFDRLF